MFTVFDNFHHRRRTAETSSLPTGDIPDCLPSVSDRLRYHFTCVFRNHLRDTRDRLRCLEGKIEVQRRRETETVAEKLYFICHENIRRSEKYTLSDVFIKHSLLLGNTLMLQWLLTGKLKINISYIQNGSKTQQVEKLSSRQQTRFSVLLWKP